MTLLVQTDTTAHGQTRKSNLNTFKKVAVRHLFSPNHERHGQICLPVEPKRSSRTWNGFGWKISDLIDKISIFPRFRDEMLLTSTHFPLWVTNDDVVFNLC